MSDKITLIGYWNEDKENPEISFNTELNSKQLYIIELTKVPPTNEDLFIESKQILKKLPKELRNLSQSIKRIIK